MLFNDELQHSQLFNFDASLTTVYYNGIDQEFTGCETVLRSFSESERKQLMGQVPTDTFIVLNLVTVEKIYIYFMKIPTFV